MLSENVCPQSRKNCNICKLGVNSTDWLLTAEVSLLKCPPHFSCATGVSATLKLFLLLMKNMVTVA